MKKGKTSKINGYENLKITYGTVDSKNIKSIYLNIQTWVTPKIDDVINWNRVVLNLSRNIKHSVLDSVEKKIFDDYFIVDLDLRTSGIQYGKKSFMNLEINLFVHSNIDFKSQLIRSSLKKIINHINVENFRKNEYFELSPSKKEKTQLVMI